MSVCLAMVCKNESKLIRAALQSVKPFITHWSIVDTGSTDGTQAIIQEELSSLPGVLHHADWRNWAHNRTQAIDLAKQSGADFIFLLDADEVVSSQLRSVILDKDSVYWVTIQYGSIAYQRPNILSAKHAWHYVGVTHEYLTAAPDAPKEEILPITLVTNPTRAFKSKERCLEDARLLEIALGLEPENTRYAFYLAQSYRDAGDYYKAIEWYEIRAAMGGWYEEVWYSYLQVACIKIWLKYPEVNVISDLGRAYEYRPSRPETLGVLVRYLRLQGWTELAFFFAKKAKIATPSKDKLFVDNSYAVWRNLDEYAILAFWTGHYRESIWACETLLSERALPPDQIERVLQNRRYSITKLEEV
jgi:glycosyltransferase involved in cell wall biosynthesis